MLGVKGLQLISRRLSIFFESIAWITPTESMNGLNWRND